MAKKNFEKGLEKLFSNVQSSEPTEEKEATPVKDDSASDENHTKRGRPALHNKVIRFCTMADDDKVTKIRTIAAREGIAIKDLMKTLPLTKLSMSMKGNTGQSGSRKSRKAAMFPRSLTYPNHQGISYEVPFFISRIRTLNPLNLPRHNRLVSGTDSKGH